MRVQNKSKSNLYSLRGLTVAGYFVLVFSIATQHLLCEGRQQLFTIHEEEDCSDKGENIKGNIRNLERFSYIGKCGIMKCFCNHYGIWVYSMNINYQRGTFPESSGLTTMHHSDGKTCQSKRFNGSFLQLKSIRHLGASNTDLPAISLYREQDHFGKELYFSGDTISLLSPIVFLSFGMTGATDWTIYPRPNFEGNSTCLRRRRKSIVGEFITFEPNKYSTVGSIRQGCVSKERERKFSEIKSYLVLFFTVQVRMNTSFLKGQPTPSRPRPSPQRKVVIDGSELRLVSPIRFASFAIVGNDNWSVYSGVEYNGKWTCLTPDGLGNDLEAIQQQRRFKRGAGVLGNGTDDVEMRRRALIGSVKKGCVPDECMDKEEDESGGFDLEFAEEMEEEDKVEVTTPDRMDKGGDDGSKSKSEGRALLTRKFMVAVVVFWALGC